MRATATCLLASCLLVQSSAFFRHPTLLQSLLPQVVERLYGRWRCAEPPFVDKVLRLEVPGQPLMVCAAASSAHWPLERSFLLSAEDGTLLRCRHCRSRWLPPPQPRSSLPQPERQCRLRPRAAPEGDPAGGLLPYRRVDAVACHRAYTMGCHRGYRWCHGSCCRRDSFFYYPDYQPKERITSPHQSLANRGVNFAVQRVVANGPVDWTKILDGTFVIIE